MPLVRGTLFLCSLILHVLVNVSGTWILLPKSLQCFLSKRRAQKIDRCIVWRFTFAKLDSFCNVWQESFKVH